MDGKEIDGFQIRVDFSITDSAHRWVFVTNDLVLQSQWKYVADSGFHTLSLFLTCRPTPGVYFHHGKATRPSSRGRTDFRGGFRGRWDCSEKLMQLWKCIITTDRVVSVLGTAWYISFTEVTWEGEADGWEAGPTIHPLARLVTTLMTASMIEDLHPRLTTKIEVGLIHCGS